MRQRALVGLAIAFALSAPASNAVAHEPDGRAVLRYEWASPARAGAPRALRVVVSAVVPLHSARIRAAVPDGVELGLHAIGRAGEALPAEPRPWPADGAAIGDVGAGESVVLDLDVVAPATGGGVLSLDVEATSDGRLVREGIGVVVGTPGTEPAIRHGATEFPARSAGRRP